MNLPGSTRNLAPPPAISSVAAGVVVPIPTEAKVLVPANLCDERLSRATFGDCAASGIPVRPVPLPINDVALTGPLTSNFAAGVLVPIPTRPPVRQSQVWFVAGAR